MFLEVLSISKLFRTVRTFHGDLEMSAEVFLDVACLLENLAASLHHAHVV